MITDVIAAPAPTSTSGSANSRGGATGKVSGSTFDSTLAGLSEETSSDAPAQQAASDAKPSSGQEPAPQSGGPTDPDTQVSDDTQNSAPNVSALLDTPTLTVADLLRGAMTTLTDAVRSGSRTPGEPDSAGETSGDVADSVESTLAGLAGAVSAEATPGEVTNSASPSQVAEVLAASNPKDGSAGTVDTPATSSTVTVEATPDNVGASTVAPATVAAHTPERVTPDGVPVAPGSDLADPALPRQAHAVSTQPAPAAPVVTGTAPTPDGVASTRGAVPVDAAAVATAMSTETSPLAHGGSPVEAADAPAAVSSAPVASAPTVSTPAPSAPAPHAPASAPTLPDPAAVATQLTARLGALRTAPAGDHVLTVRVDPDSIGPVRVVAHIGADGVRIELAGGTDAARDALRTALPDLRRDLAGLGMSADLDLADQPGFGDEAREQNEPGNGPALATTAHTTTSDTAEPRSGGTHAGRLDLEI
jgi:flagellar hook-length control protein FliK